MRAKGKQNKKKGIPRIKQKTFFLKTKKKTKGVKKSKHPPHRRRAAHELLTHAMSFGVLHDFMLVVDDLDAASSMIASLDPNDPSGEVVETLLGEGCTKEKIPTACAKLVSPPTCVRACVRARCPTCSLPCARSALSGGAR